MFWQMLQGDGDLLPRQRDLFLLIQFSRRRDLRYAEFVPRLIRYHRLLREGGRHVHVPHARRSSFDFKLAQDTRRLLEGPWEQLLRPIILWAEVLRIPVNTLLVALVVGPGTDN